MIVRLFRFHSRDSQKCHRMSTLFLHCSDRRRSAAPETTSTCVVIGTSTSLHTLGRRTSTGSTTTHPIGPQGYNNYMCYSYSVNKYNHSGTSSSSPSRSHKVLWRRQSFCIRKCHHLRSLPNVLQGEIVLQVRDGPELCQ